MFAITANPAQVCNEFSVCNCTNFHFRFPTQNVLAQISLVSGFRPPMSRVTGRLNNGRKNSSNKASAEAATAVDICPQSFEVAVASIMKNPSFVNMIRNGLKLYDLRRLS